MRVTVKVGKHELHILVDCGSTHNFLDDSVAKRIGCPLKDTCPLAVTLQGETFKADMMILPLGGCEMVLSIQWRMVLRGASKTTLNWMEGKHQEKEVERVPHAEILMLNVFLNNGIQLMILRELPPHRSYDHRIPLLEGIQPVNIRPYRHPPIQNDAIKAMVRELLEAGVIKPSNSPFASPILMVKKKDNTWRMCVDYRQLNKNTVKDKFPIPIIEELIDELHGATIFSKLDLRSSYHQIRMCEEDIAKTAFKTHEMHYEFLFMPFGLTNAPPTFQALMNKVFKAFLRKFTLVFFDDILVYSQTMEEHVTHLQMPNKVEAMQDWPILTTLKQLKSFLGLTGYYRRFIKGFASLSRPLTQLLKKNTFKWTSEAQLSFEALKRAMMEAPILGLPDFSEPFVIKTYASGVGLGAVLQQKGHPIEYLSKTFSPKHQFLSTYEKEFLVVLMALER
ncbi:putative mitochondrial protein [Tanacetum coccineum]|uniref:Mitochondrial protein n=1 Tax=Tanacetum coccineum TaxID=301880 RepID=A0ABQ5D9R2_9ASTR